MGRLLYVTSSRIFSFLFLCDFFDGSVSCCSRTDKGSSLTIKTRGENEPGLEKHCLAEMLGSDSVCGDLASQDAVDSHEINIECLDLVHLWF